MLSVAENEQFSCFTRFVLYDPDPVKLLYWNVTLQMIVDCIGESKHTQQTKCKIYLPGFVSNNYNLVPVTIFRIDSV